MILLNKQTYKINKEMKNIKNYMKVIMVMKIMMI
jgi:hypothetical protein